MSIYLQHGLIFLDVPGTPLALIPGMNTDRGGVTLHPRSEVGAESNSTSSRILFAGCLLFVGQKFQ